MDYHRYSGYTLLGVLVFRLYWGFFGSRTARFAQFVKGPRAVLEYLRAGASASGHNAAGHNPLGALSVIALIVLLSAQVALGLFAVDVDGLESGPLSYLVSFDVGRTCAKIHETLFNVLMAVVVLHIVAIFFYLLFKRDNLIRPMITGNKSLPAQVSISAESTSLLRVTIGIALAIAIVWAIV
jgi:cytochrome b